VRILKEKYLKNIKAAGYYRLSRDDGDKSESDSITNQKSLILEYAEKNKLSLEDEYVDDGYSGTNFDRPGFIRMMNDIRNGDINCIIIKDFSRLGRNYIEMGKYMTKIFPSMGVRLISINDNYDSLRDNDLSDQIIIPFKNLINDAYCRDISMKIRSQLDIKRKNGQYIASFPLYGYEKDPENHNHLIIDTVAAEAVQLIFNLKLDGYNQRAIVAKLNELAIPTPLEYRRMRSRDYNNSFPKYKNGWNLSSVNRILKNEMYTGVMIQGKHKKINYKVKKSLEVPESGWIRCEGTHDAIIPKEIFDIVQKVMKRDTRTAPNKDELYLFSGFLKCCDCGQNMIRHTSTKKGKQYVYYRCSSNKLGEKCTAHLISEKMVEETVLKSIQNIYSYVTEHKEALEAVDSISGNNITVKLLDRQIESQLKEVERYNNMKVKLYQDYSDGMITKDDYIEFSNSFREKVAQIETSIEANKQKKDNLSDINLDSVPWVKSLMDMKTFDKLERRMLVSMVESIVVYDKDRIEVKFNNGEALEELMLLVDEFNERKAVSV